MAIRKTQGQGMPRQVRIRQSKNTLHQLVYDLDRLSAISIIGINATDIEIEIKDNNTFNFFNGDWLEVYAFTQAKSCMNGGKDLFNDVQMSVEIPLDGAIKEIDLACMHGAQLLIASIKTEEKPFKTEHLDEISAVANLVGDRFCKKMFITQVVPRNSSKSDQKTFQSFLDQAKQRAIVVVSGQDLPKLKEVLEREAIKPSYRPS